MYIHAKGIETAPKNAKIIDIAIIFMVKSQENFSMIFPKETLKYNTLSFVKQIIHTLNTRSHLMHTIF